MSSPEWDNPVARAIITEAVKEVWKGGVNLIQSGIKNLRDGSDQKKSKLEVETKAKSAEMEIDWHKSATLIWLGNDLMWIQDMLYRAALPERVLQGVENAQKYVRNLGFGANSFPDQQLAIAADVLGAIAGGPTKEAMFNEQVSHRYAEVSQLITTVKWYLSALAEQREPGFEKLRAFEP